MSEIFLVEKKRVGCLSKILKLVSKSVLNPGVIRAILNSEVNKTITSINNTAGNGGFFATRVVVNTSSAGIVTAFNAPYAELRRSLKVSVITNASTGKAFIQQVQVS